MPAVTRSCRPDGIYAPNLISPHASMPTSTWRATRPRLGTALRRSRHVAASREGGPLFLSISQWKRPTPKACGRIETMRPSTALSAAVIASLATTVGIAGIATAAPDPTITADPVRVDSNAIQTVRGRNWPVIEFCSRTIRVSVRSPQNSAPIAQRHVSDSGRFRSAGSPTTRTSLRAAGGWSRACAARAARTAPPSSSVRAG